MPISAARLTSIIAALDELLDIGAFSDLGPNGLQVPGRAGGEPRGHRRVGPAGADRAGRRRGCAARARPPRAVLGLPPDRPVARAGRAPATAVQARRRARRLPPAARRPPGAAATTRSWPTGSAASVTSRSGVPGRRDRPRRHVRGRRDPGRRPVRARARGHGPHADCVRRRPRDGPADRHRVGLRRRRAARGDRRSASTPSSPASRASTSWRTRARRASTSSPPATTRPRPSASAPSAIWLERRFGVEHLLVDIPNPV